jgi:DNA mismatch repair protein MutH
LNARSASASATLRNAPPADERELVERAESLAGESLGRLAARAGIRVPENLRRAKGWVGDLLEYLLGATAQSRPVPDFETLGIELKTLPLNARQQPQESTFVSTVPMADVAGLQWADSPVRAKLECVLWIPIEATREVPLEHRRVGHPILWRPTPDEAAILRADWEEHIEHIALGRLEELDARMGTYLQVRPKAFTRDDRTATFGADGAPTTSLPRGFYLRTSLTRKILSQVTHRE